MNNLVGVSVDNVAQENGRTNVHKEPSSLEDALAERRILVEQTMSIDAQLGDMLRTDVHGRPLSRTEYAEWRKKAIGAKRIKTRRLLFLKEWIRDQDKSQPRRNPEQVDDIPSDIPITTLLRRVTRRVGLLYAIYRAALIYVEQDTDESWEELAALVDRMKQAEQDSLVDSLQSENIREATGDDE